MSFKIVYIHFPCGLYYAPTVLRGMNTVLNCTSESNIEKDEVKGYDIQIVTIDPLAKYGEGEFHRPYGNDDEVLDRTISWLLDQSPDCILIGSSRSIERKIVKAIPGVFAQAGLTSPFMIHFEPDLCKQITDTEHPFIFSTPKDTAHLLILLVDPDFVDAIRDRQMPIIRQIIERYNRDQNLRVFNWFAN